MTLDWPGFGQSERLPIEYGALLYQKFLQDFVRDILKRPTAVVAAGHAAGYVIQLARSPLLGEALYQLNTNPAFLRLMYERHVYTDETKLTPEFIDQKWQITQHPGARYAPAAFVTGALDPVQERSDFLAYFQPLPVPVMVIIGEQVPP